MPDFKTEVRERLSRLNLEPTREAAIVEEMAQHLEQRFEELVARGMGRAAARDTVLKELKEGTRLEKELLQVERQVSVEPAEPAAPGLGSTLAHLQKDLRHGMRSLRLSFPLSPFSLWPWASGRIRQSFSCSTLSACAACR
jgi:putative ABC transport system permease protein